MENDDGGADVGVNEEAAERAENEGVVVRFGFAGAFGVNAADDSIHVLEFVVRVFSGTDARYALDDAVYIAGTVKEYCRARRQRKQPRSFEFPHRDVRHDSILRRFRSDSLEQVP